MIEINSFTQNNPIMLTLKSYNYNCSLQLNASPVFNQILLPTNLDTNANMIEEKIYASTT